MAKLKQIKQVFNTSSANLKLLGAECRLINEEFKTGKITLDQAKARGRLCSDSIRAELASSMLDAQIIGLKKAGKKPKVITLK